MAHHKSARQQLRRSLRRNRINKSTKSELRTQVKKARTAIAGNNSDEVQKILPKTLSIIDRAVKKGTIHRNTGNRYKSRLSKQVDKATAVPSK